MYLKKLFNTNIPPACAYCKFGRMSPDGSMILCVKKGFMAPNSHCKAFSYDALKREPRKAPKIFTGWTQEDFDL